MSLPRTVKAVVFDMDGLLIDTETAARDAFLAATALHGHDVPMDVYGRMIGTPGVISREILQAHFGPGVSIEDLWGAWDDHYEARMDAGVSLKAGVVELLDHLDAAGLRRAIATSSPHEHVRRHLGRHGLTDRFHAVVARGDYERGKPNPDPYLKAAGVLGVLPAHCLALEESLNGVRAAHGAGMLTVMVPDLLDPPEEIRGLCVRIADSLHEVRELLAGQGARR